MMATKTGAAPAVAIVAVAGNKRGRQQSAATGSTLILHEIITF
jgi:hypothetical protein